MHRRSFLAGLCASAIVPARPRLTLAQGADGFIELTARTGSAPLLGGDSPETAIWAFDGTTPGPELRLRQGEEARIRLVNRIEQGTTVHWHGLRIDNAMDGVPHLTQAPVQTGESFEYVFTPPDAGTYWYHTHAHSSEQLARGLYGPLIVEEREALNFAADRLLVIDDWRIGDDGVIEETFGNLHDASHAGRLGNWLTVNGSSQPDFEIAHGACSRVRLLNACNSRVLALKIAEARVKIIAHDGQPVAPQELEKGELELSPGQRVDLFFDNDLADGVPVVLSELTQDPPLTVATLTPRATGFLDLYGGGRFQGLPDNPAIAVPELRDALRMPLDMTGGAMGSLEKAIYQGEELDIRQLIDKGQVWALNGVAGRSEEPLFRVKRGRTVVLDMVNDTAWPHAMHIHGHHFRTIARNGEDVADPPWRDTVLSDISQRSSLAFVADNPGKWLIHCHMIEHHAAGMVTWFEVEA